LHDDHDESNENNFLTPRRLVASQFVTSDHEMELADLRGENIKFKTFNLDNFFEKNFFSSF
jgi:hypothetical protein